MPTDTAPIVNRIAVCPVKLVKGVSANDDGDGLVYQVLPLKQALEASYDSDAHLVPYVADEGEPLPWNRGKQARINKDGLPRVKAAGGKVTCSALFCDVDNPEHGPWTDELAASFEQQWITLPVFQTCGVYFTAHGYRLVQPLPEPVSVPDVELVNLAWLWELWRAGIPVDWNCKAWNWHFRLPNVVREGKPFKSPFMDLSRMAVRCIPLLERFDGPFFEGGFAGRAGRDVSTYRYCCKLRNDGLDAPEMLERARTFDREHNFPQPLGDAIVAQKVASACKHEPGKAGDSFVTLDASKIWEPLGPIPWLIEGLIPRGSIVEAEAYGGSGKSWIGVEALVAVAQKRPFLGRFPTQGGDTAYLDFENGNRECRRRIQACAKAHAPGPVPGLVLVTMPDLYLTSDLAEAALVELAKGRVLIVLDTLRAATPGLDENDSRMRMPLDMLRRVAERTGCAFLVLVHSKKTGPNGPVDMRETGRGSSAIYDGADVVMHCTYKEPTLHVAPGKTRIGVKFAPFIVTITDGPGGCVEVMAKDAPTLHDAIHEAFEELMVKAFAVVRDNPRCSGRLVREKIGGNASKAAAALEALERVGAIENMSSGKNGEWVPRAETYVPLPKGGLSQKVLKQAHVIEN